MVHLGDMRSIFNFGRMLGCTSYICTDNDIKIRKLRNIFFITFSMSLYSCALIFLHVCVVRFDFSNPKSFFLVTMRLFLFYSCFFTDATFTTIWNWKIRAALSQLRNFDRATKFNDPKKRHLVRIVSHILPVITFIFWMINGYLGNRLDIEMAAFRGSLFAVMGASLCTQIQMFSGFLLLIQERFRRLCNMLTFSTEGKLMVADRLHGHFTLQQIWWLHCTLVNATEMINSVYAVQLPLWISAMSFNGMARIYALIAYKLSVYGRINESLMVVVCVWNLLLITTICHWTAYQANRVGEIIFAPTSSASVNRVFLHENVEAAAYFQMRKLHIFAIAGFIRVNLPLLLSIVSAITTYLVILS